MDRNTFCFGLCVVLGAVCDAQAFVMTAEVKERTLVRPKEGATCGVHSSPVLPLCPFPA